MRNIYNNLPKRRFKKKLVKKLISVILIVILGIAISIYFNLNNKEVNEEIKYEILTEVEVEMPITIININSTSRPYAVMINNLSTARAYHSGLQDAYLLYEIIVEGGVTRYMALYKDVETEVIGSVRSSRHYFLDYALENDAYYVHWGWSPQAQSDISSYNIDNINGLIYEGKYFYRENLNISYEHTGYTTMNMLNEAAEKLGYRSITNKDLLLDYSGKVLYYDDSIVANNVEITFSQYVTSSFVYNEKTGNYYMSVNNVSHDDYITKEQYYYKNIITYTIENQTMSGESTRQEIFNIGNGEGYYISAGEAIEILWEKKSRDDQTVYTVKATGEELVVNDGNTYIGLQPLNQSLNIY